MVSAQDHNDAPLVAMIEDKDRTSSNESDDEKSLSARRKDELEVVVNGPNDNSSPSPSQDVEKSKLASEPPAQQRTITGLKWVVLIISLLASLFLCVMDHTVLANVRPNIISTFGHIELLPVISVFYTLAIASVTPVWGKLNSKFDKKKLFLAAVAIFEIGSALNGAAQNMGMLIAGRFLAGLGSAGLYVGLTNIVSFLTVPTERAQYLSYIGIAWALGTILGPVIGGAFADSSATWRWAFYLNLCVAAVTVPIYIFLIPTMRQTSEEQSVLQRIKRLDYMGAILYTGGTIALILILSFGGSLYTWGSGQMIALYVVTVVIWVLFALQQTKTILTTTADRLFPVQFVGEWQMINLFTWTGLALGNLLIPVYTLPLLFQFGYGYSSLKAAKYMLPFLGSAVFTVILGGKLFPKYPVYMLWYVASAVLMIIGSGLLANVDIGTPIGAICGFSVIYGLGSGLVAQLGLVVGQLKRPGLQAQVTTFLTCGQISGSVLAISLSTVIFINRATVDIGALLPGLPRDRVQSAINGSGDKSLFEGLSAETRDAVVAVIVRDAAKVFYLSLAGAALGLMHALTMPRERLMLKGPASK